MKVKTPVSDNRYGKRLLRLFKKRSFVLIVAFISYNIFLGAMVFSLFQNQVSHAMRGRILAKMNSIKKAVTSFGHPEQEINVDPEHLELTLQSEDLQLLSNIKNHLLKEEETSDQEIKKVSALLTWKEKDYPVEVSIKGKIPTSWGEEYDWPILVKSVSSDFIHGMKKFSLRAPTGSDCLLEWISHELFKTSDIGTLAYDFVSLAINGSRPRTYIIQEEIDDWYQQTGPVIDLWDVLWENERPAEAGSFPERNGARDKAIQLAMSYLEGKVNPLEVFDGPKLARFMALTDLLGINHPANLEKMQFYYDTVLNILEPIAMGRPTFETLKDYGLSGAEKQINQSPKPTSTLERIHWYARLFEEKSFMQSYVNTLEKIGSHNFLQESLENFEHNLLEKQKLLKQDNSQLKFQAISIIYENQEYIRKAVEPVKLLQVYFNSNKSSGNHLHFEAANIHHLPVEMLSASIGDSIHLNFVEAPEVLQSNIQTNPVSWQTFKMIFPAKYVLTDTLLAGMVVSCRTLGSARIVLEPVIPYSVFDEELIIGDLVRQKSNIAEFDFLVVNEDQKRIEVKQGTHLLNKNLIIPGGYRIFAQGDTKMDMTNHANILSYSPLQWIGEKERPITFFSSDSTAQGITILNAKEESHLQYIHFDNLSNPMRSGWSLTSGITFYESPVTIEYCLFENNRRGDDYLNIVRCKYVIDKSVFFNAHADAFDGDFSEGIIRNTQFINSGNDAIDVSGSHLTLENILIDITGDKGISAGERSSLTARGIKIKNAELAVTSKDLSSIIIEDIDIEDSRVAYSAFEKKPEYGPARIEVTKHSSISGKTEIPYLIEANSVLIITGEKIGSNTGMEHVKQMLYGVKYGKSSQ